MPLFKKHNAKRRSVSEVPGYGRKWLPGTRNSSRASWKKGKNPAKLPDFPVDTSFVYYEDK